MSAVFSPSGMSLPDLIRTKLADRLVRLGRVGETVGITGFSVEL